MIGQTLGHYHILEKIGEGGMGEVYRAQDDRLRRTVAIKVLPKEIASHAERRARILAEARAAAALNHPSITTIYEVGEEEEQVFIVMEVVSGETLRAMLSEGPPDPRTLVRLGAQVAEALAAAHAQGVVHGDIKPENIVVQPDGRLKLLDFEIDRGKMIYYRPPLASETTMDRLHFLDQAGDLVHLAAAGKGRGIRTLPLPFHQRERAHAGALGQQT